MTNIALVPVSGDLCVTTIDRLRTSIDRLVDDGCRRIVLNLADVGYIDSSGMGLILVEARRMRRAGGLLSLINVGPQAYRSLCLARVVDFIPVSCQGASKDVPELDASVSPVWNCTMSVDCATMQDVRQRVSLLLGQAPLSDDEVFDMTLAVGEAIGNAIDHTTCDSALVTAEGYPDRVVFTVTDCGEGFDACDKQDAPTPCDAERGRGIKLMRLLADSVTIARRGSGTGTVVTLVKLCRRV